MNKAVIDAQINTAYQALQDTGIAHNGEIKKTFRGQISSFGAAVTMGSLKSAVAFFSLQGGSLVERPKLMKAVLQVLKNDPTTNAARYNTLFDYVSQGNTDVDEIRENVLNAAVALKLAMNLFKLVDNKTRQREGEQVTAAAQPAAEA